MSDRKKLKKEVYENAIVLIEEKISAFQKAIHDAKESRKNETKSSVGDKYETGRALLQSEIQRNEIQLSKTVQLKNSLYQIDMEKDYKKVEIGSLILSNRGRFFIAVGLGKIMVAEGTVFMISLASPIGKVLLDKQAGEVVSFQGKELIINEII